MWTVTLSNGEKIVQGEGDWVEKPGELLPWARLCEYTKDNNLVIEELEFRFGERKLKFSPDRFYGLNGLTPLNYSIQTTMELDGVFSGGQATMFEDVCCHFALLDGHTVDIHFIINKDNGDCGS